MRLPFVCASAESVGPRLFYHTSRALRKPVSLYRHVLDLVAVAIANAVETLREPPTR